ncbi:MAG: cadherin-like beta sandwich domain-containing protein, partial [Bacteroidota bacterium]|nr:cadherin-like beta sandwich domain-containing protein [Bacteroidota bacterium]
DFDSNGNFVTKWGSYGSGNGQFNSPKGVAYFSHNIYVADTLNNRIQKINTGIDGNYLTQWGSKGSGNGQFDSPFGVAVDSSGNVYVTDTGNRRIQKFTSNGNFITKWGSLGPGSGQFLNPKGVAVDSSGNVYVADTDNNRIQKFDSNGNFITNWGSYGIGNGQFNNPVGVAVDSSGNVYVADYWNSRIQKFAPVSTDANLSALTVSSGSLVPGFSLGTLTYTDSVANSVSNITFTPKANESHAIIKVNGTTVLSGQASKPISLIVGSNTINIAVTAQDGTTQKTYTIKVTRAASTDAKLSALTVSNGSLVPVFSPGTPIYTDSVANSVSSITFTPKANESHAIIKVNGATVLNGQASNPISLAVGPNKINVTVTAQDGTTQKLYAILVIRAAVLSNDANLSSLTVSSGSLVPVFSPGTLTYTDSVANSVSNITFTPKANESHAIIKVNGTTVLNGQVSQPISLIVGSNIINVKVTAQDGTTQKNYNIKVTSEAGSAERP